MTEKEVAKKVESLSKQLGDVDLSGAEGWVWEDISHIQNELLSLADRLKADS